MCRYFTFITECENPKACTVLLRGPSKDMLMEVERNLQDAMNVVRNVMMNPKLVPGGGATGTAKKIKIKKKERQRRRRKKERKKRERKKKERRKKESEESLCVTLMLQLFPALPCCSRTHCLSPLSSFFHSFFHSFFSSFSFFFFSLFLVIEMALSVFLKERSHSVEGVAQWPYKALSEALTVIPVTLIRNCGKDIIRTLTQLRAKQAEGHLTFGVNGNTGDLADMNVLGIWEPFAVKAQTLKTSIETAILLLRIDAIVSGLKKPKAEASGGGAPAAPEGEQAVDPDQM